MLFAYGKKRYSHDVAHLQLLKMAIEKKRKIIGHCDFNVNMARILFSENFVKFYASC